MLFSHPVPYPPGTANHEVRYSIVGGDPLKNFTLDQISGELKPSGPLDFEKLTQQKENAFYNLTVKVHTVILFYLNNHGSKKYCNLTVKIPTVTLGYLK